MGLLSSKTIRNSSCNITIIHISKKMIIIIPAHKIPAFKLAKEFIEKVK